MHDDQVHMDADVIRRMIIDQFPECRHERIEKLGATGTVNAIFRIGSGLAARFPLRTMKPLECADMLRREAAAMTELARHSPIATPRPLGLVHGEHLVGVLDAGSFGPADPALGLVAAWHLLDRDRREIVRSHLGSGELEWTCGAAWAFQQAMGLVWYYERTNPSMSALGRNTVCRLLEDLVV
ncbi:hypothetical protein [Microvirga sp. M2]|uniref:hypothetical protein n=1 Tax=Microvirga sp. M2 TaxID=3073270 RepID=UPI0039C0D06A